MALTVIVKNTFLDVDESDSGSTCGSTRRSSSVPCTWKPRGFSLDSGSFDMHPTTSPSSGSTAASDCDLCDGLAADTHEHEDFRASAPLPKKGSLNPEAAEFQMPVTSEVFVPGLASSTRLNPEARAFEPTPVNQGGSLLPPEISEVFAAAETALHGCPHISSVKVTEGPMGQPTSIVGEIHDSAGPYGTREALAQAKAALLGAAARSQITYVLGYSTSPFQDMCDSGFKATIGSIPVNMQDSICWDTYQKGYCPRRALCRWCHPVETDLAPLRVILKRAP